MTRRQWTLALASLPLALAACERGPSGPAADQSSTPGPPAAASASPSIIRPEVLPEPAVESLGALEATIPFADGGNDLGEAAERVLAGLLESDQLAQGWPIVLRGHTDSVGHDEANLRVSRRRAEAVADRLVEHGIDRARIEIVALGEQRPRAPNALPDGTPDEEGRAANRRVTITIAPVAPEMREDDPEGPEPASEG
jgi:OOP family OmpA-OmpF porin